MSDRAMRRPILPLAMLPLVVLLLNAAVWPSAGQAADTTRPEKTEGLTAEEQKSALDFVKEHHPQLNTLISRLKKRDPAGYHKALKDVFRTYERLQRMEGRDRPRYEVELELWKVNSRVRLLAARMVADQRPELENQLRELLNERTDLRLQQLALERKRLNSRLERVDSQVRQLSTQRDAAIDKELERLRRSVRARSLKGSKLKGSKKAIREAPADAGTKDRAAQQPRPARKKEAAERPADNPSH